MATTLDLLLTELLENDGWLQLSSSGKVTCGYPRSTGPGHVTRSCERSDLSPAERMGQALNSLFS